MHIYRLVAVLLTAAYVTAAPIHLNTKDGSHPTGGDVANVQPHHTHKNHHAQILSPESIHDDTVVNPPADVETGSVGGPHPAKRTSVARVAHALERRGGVPPFTSIAEAFKRLRAYVIANGHKRPDPKHVSKGSKRKNQ